MKRVVAILTMCLLSQLAWAQLPEILVTNVRGRNVISWKNPFDGIMSIVIERSTDSIRGYQKIGTLNKPKKGDNFFVDELPVLGKQYYQVKVFFSQDVDWYSNRRYIILDSTMIAKSAGPAIDTVAISNTSAIITDSKPAEVEFAFTASTHVYTNSFTGHINITLENTLEKRYSVVFYDALNTEALKIDRIGHDNLVLDKHNFNGKGLFQFVLKESGKEVEKGYVRIN
jgi:hypothetical protein